MEINTVNDTVCATELMCVDKQKLQVVENFHYSSFANIPEVGGIIGFGKEIKPEEDATDADDEQISSFFWSFYLKEADRLKVKPMFGIFLKPNGHSGDLPDGIMTLGGANAKFVPSGQEVNWVLAEKSSQSWQMTLAKVRLGDEPLDRSSLHYDVLTLRMMKSVLGLPTTTYKSLEAAIHNLPERLFKCNVEGCFANKVCSELKDALPPLEFDLLQGKTLSLSFNNLLQDGYNTYGQPNCQIMIKDFGSSSNEIHVGQAIF